MSHRPRTIAIIQARMSSTRLPGKVLMPIGGLPSILFMCARVVRAREVDAVCVATSIDRSDDALAATIKAGGVPVFRGSLNDVLDRFASAAEAHGAERVVRLTGDCPLIDPAVIDKVLLALQDGQADYASNVAPPTYPDGLDVEAMTAAALQRARKEARLTSEREHVTLYLRSAEQFSRINVEGPADLSGLRWTVDYPDDYQHILRLVDAVGSDPLLADRYDYLRAHEAVGRQADHVRNEGLAASLIGDRGREAG